VEKPEKTRGGGGAENRGNLSEKKKLYKTFSHNKDVVRQRGRVGDIP